MNRIVFGLLILLLLCLPRTACAQITLGNNTVVLTWVGDNFGDGPWIPDITVNGSGTLSLGSCTGDSAVTSNIRAAFTPSTAPSVLSLYFAEQSLLGDLGAGTYVGHCAIVSTNGCGGNCTIDITLTLIGRSALYQPMITTPSGSCAGCSAKTTYRQWAFWDNDLASWLPDQVPGGTFPFPDAGSSYVDGNFGATVTQLAEPAFGFTSEIMQNDSAATVWNSDHSRSMTGLQNGTLHIWKTATKLIEYTGLPGFSFWSPVSPLVFYYLTGIDNFMHKVTLVSGPSTWTDTIDFTYPGTGPIKSGGNMQASKDNWAALMTVDTSSPDNKIMLVNLGNTTEVYYTARIPDNMYSPKFILLSVGADSITGYRYIIEGDVPQDPPAHIEGHRFWKWKPGDATITHSHFHPIKRYYRTHGPFPTLGGACDAATYRLSECVGGGHSSVVEVNGRQFFATIGNSSEQATSHCLELIAAGDLMSTPVEVGGGQYATLSISPQVADTHEGGAVNAPVVALDLDSDTPGAGPVSPINWWITGATTTTPIQLTYTQSCGDGTDPRCPGAYNGANGDVLLVSGLYGITGLTGQAGANGLCTVGNLTATTLTCTGTVGVGTYTASSGVFTKNVKPSVTSYQSEVLVFDYTNLLSLHTYQVTRLLKTRSITWTTRYNDNYYGQAHVSVSPDGMYVEYGSNLGFAEQLTIFIAATGYTPPPLVTGSVLGGRFVMSGKVVIH